MRKNSHRKHTKYHDLIRQHEHFFSEVKYINLSVSALGVFDQLSQSFLDMLKDLNYIPSTRNYITRKISTCHSSNVLYFLPSKQRLGQSWIAVMLNIFDRIHCFCFLNYYVLCILCIQVASCRLPE